LFFISRVSFDEFDMDDGKSMLEIMLASTVPGLLSLAQFLSSKCEKLSSRYKNKSLHAVEK
jgi:hypothetical protein